MATVDTLKEYRTYESKQKDTHQSKNRVIITCDLPRSMNTKTNNTFIQLTWHNHIILSKQTVSYLISQIEHHLSLKQHGFIILKDENIWIQFVNRYLQKERTIHGELLRDNPRITLLIKSLKASLWRMKSLNSSYKIKQILSSPLFQHNWRFGGNNVVLPKDGVNKWLQMSIIHGVPPFALLQKWIIKQNLMQNNKQINKFLDKLEHQYGQMPESSLCGFCQSIATKDLFSRINQEIERVKATQFEQLIFNKLIKFVDYAKKVSPAIKVTLLTEDEQRTKQEMLLKNNKDHKNIVRLTPDILIQNGPIIVNNHAVNWMDMKNYFITSRDTLLFKKLKSTCTKYTKAFGSGAIVCRGFEKDIDIATGALFLDAFSL